ncbi:unnamed protein product [Bursaphelenchus xylophilus]|uniref:(pine wood nematode) hypothetical protein n=1 Tax=Bursaphelenchus xylophilus TaxID=6326 RepID=A0A1I7S9Y0_BURXY|nr:unnamed protein product [Bursaphelenchus xylophilus]CAG9126191.1 unnamed protein product [Bursaphelenchus xylophilus]
MNTYNTVLGASTAFLATAVVIQSGALYFLYRKLKALRIKCEQTTSTCNALQDDVNGLKQRVKHLEEQQAPQKQRNTVTFPSFIPPSSGDPASTSMSRVASLTSSSDFQDAYDDWPDDGTAPLINLEGDWKSNGSVETTGLKHADELHEKGEHQKCYDELKKRAEAEPTNPEVLWRFARACHSLANTFDQKNPKRKELVQEGHKFAVAAYKITDKDFNVLKWAAVLSGALTDYLGTKDKIKEGFTFKEYLDKGLAISPGEYSLLHMRGRFSYNVANLSWLERKAAAAFFATPPTATFDEAITDFAEVEKLKPDWVENLIFLAKSYIAKGDKEKAKAVLNRTIKLQPEDEADREFIEEAKKTLKSL